MIYYPPFSSTPERATKFFCIEYGLRVVRFSDLVSISTLSAITSASEVDMMLHAARTSKSIYALLHPAHEVKFHPDEIVRRYKELARKQAADALSTSKA